MGVVYKAEDTNLKRPVALKFLAAHLLGDEEVKARFRREAEATAALNHPNVCTVHEIAEANGKTFIAMAFLEGEPLEKKIEAGPLKLKDALDIAIQTARGLEAAHEKKIVHRDIKPANLMITGAGSKRLVTIMDFGLALLADRSKLTRLDETMGTVAYMSPEQTYGMELDHRTDVWSLGVVIYEMVTGQRPFKGHYDKAVMYSITNEEPEPMTALRTGVPMELELLVNKCLAKEADRRYQSTADMVVDLETLSEKLKSGKSTILRTGAPDGPSDAGARVVPPVGQTIVSGQEQAGLPAVPAAGTRASGGFRTWQVVAASLLTVGAIAFWVRRPEGDQSQREAWKVTRVTSTPEWENSASASSASSLIAYSSSASGNLDIYVMPVGGGKPLQLTTHLGDDDHPRLSPDGELVVYNSDRGGGTLYTVPVTGGASHALARTGLTDGAGVLGRIPWRVKAGLTDVLFSRREGDRMAIWRIAPASLEEIQISQPREGEEHRFASYSPDGDQIAFVLSRSGFPNEIWTLPAEGGEPRPILRDEFNIGGPAWTPDGTRLVFGSYRSGAQNVWELTLASGGMRQITVGPGRERAAFVVPGKGLFYMHFSHTLDLMKVDLGGGSHEALTAVSDVAQMYPRFSPDGRFLVYDSNRGGDYEIVRLDLTTGETTPLTDNATSDRNPDWSPVSDELVFVSNQDGKPALWLMDSDGRSRRRLRLPSADLVEPLFSTGASPRQGPRWSPDGTVIGYVGLGADGPEFWSVRPDGRDAKRLLAGVSSFDWYGDSGRVVVYSSPSNAGEAELRAVNLDTKAEVVLLSGPSISIDVAPDGASVAYVRGHGH